MTLHSELLANYPDFQEVDFLSSFVVGSKQPVRWVSHNGHVWFAVKDLERSCGVNYNPNHLRKLKLRGTIKRFSGSQLNVLKDLMQLQGQQRLKSSAQTLCDAIYAIEYIKHLKNRRCYTPDPDPMLSLMSGNPDRITEFRELCDEYRLMWVEHNKQAVFFLYQLIKLKGISYDTYNELALGGFELTITGVNLEIIKRLVSKTYGATINNNRVRVVSWERALDLMKYKPKATSVQDTSTQVVDSSTPKATPMAAMKPYLHPVQPKPEVTQPKWDSSEEELQRAICYLTTFSDMHLRQELSLVDEFTSAHTRRFDLVHRSAEGIHIYEIKKSPISVDHIRFKLNDSRYLDVLQSHFPGVPIKLTFLGSNRPSLSALQEAYSYENVYIRSIYDFVQDILNNIRNTTPKEAYWFIIKRILPQEDFACLIA